MIYEFIERLEDFFKAIIHRFFRAMFCTYYDQDRCRNRKQKNILGTNGFCRYWHCPKRRKVMKGADDE